MTALVLDSGALIALERNDRIVMAMLREGRAAGVDARTSPVAVAQVWRNRTGRQAQLARVLRGIDVPEIDRQMGVDAGELLGRAGTGDVVDALIVLIARPGDTILTSDPGDIRHLVATVGLAIAVITC